MKSIAQLSKTTIIGGFLVILPVALVVFLVAKVVVGLRVVIDPLVASLPPGPLGGPFAATLAAIVVILVACFVTGTLVRTALGERAWHAFETGVLHHIPGYDIVRVLSRRILGREEGKGFAPAFAVFDDCITPAFVVEEHADGRYTVFVPSVPTPAVGALYIMDHDRVRLVDVSFQHAVRCITQWGVGSGELLRAMKPD